MSLRECIHYKALENLHIVLAGFLAGVRAVMLSGNNFRF